MPTLVLPETAPTSGPERLHELPIVVGLEDGVAVDHDDDVVRATAMPVFSAAGLPALAWRMTVTCGARGRLDDLGGAVGRAVVDDDDLEAG